MAVARSCPPDEIHSDGLLIRRYVPSDAVDLHESVLASHDHLSSWMAWIAYEPQSIEERASLIEKWIEDWNARSDFVMCIRMGHQFVGSTGVHLRGAVDTVEIGYWVDVRHLGNRIAQRATNALTRTAFDTWPHVGKVEIHVDANNVASIKVAETCGFVLSGEENRTPLAPGESGRLLHWRKERPTN